MKTVTRRSGAVRLLIVLVLGMALGRTVCAPSPAAAPAEPPATEGASAQVTWTCSMHPQIRLPEAGACPLCGMDLIPVSEDAAADSGPRELVMSEAAAALAEIVTAPVERRPVTRAVRMVGRVTYDETRMASLTAWIPGRLDRLFVDYTGVSVRAGDHMVEIYSPDLIATQKELLQAIATERALRDSPSDLLRDRQLASVEAARERLRLWGLTPVQVDEIVERGEPLEKVTIEAPIGGVVVHKDALEGTYVETGTRIYTIADLSHVWVQLDAYESDLHWLHYGQAVRFRAQASPGRVFEGRIAFIDPVLDDRTRTIKVRVNVDNADGALKPDMFVRGVVEAQVAATGKPIDTELAGRWMCPMHPEVVAPDAGDCDLCGMALAPVEELGFTPAEPGELPLVVPLTAPLVTGERAIVYVRVPSRDQPTFEGREVLLGPRTDDGYIVAEGLAEGELVVVHGNFKIDSELQIRGKPSMMSPSGGSTNAGHDHAGGSRTHGSAGAPLTGVPAAFRDELSGVLEATLALHAALVADDAHALPALVGTPAARLDKVHAEELTGEARDAWPAAAPELERAAAALAEARGLEPTRAAFHAFQLALLPALDLFGLPSGDDGLALFHCPMAFEGAGGHWLALGDEVLNPYFGASMLRCGDRVRGVPAGR